MKILHVCTLDRGGAGLAVVRLVKALRQHNIDANLLVFEASKELAYRDDSMPILETVKKFPFVLSLNDNSSFKEKTLSNWVMKHSIKQFDRLQKRYKASFSSNLTWHPIRRVIERLEYDILHLHWIGMGFVPIKSLSNWKKPIVWTQHDMWGFTGGCHITQQCDRYQQQCGMCPILNSDSDNDISRQVFLAKQKHWHNIDFNVVTPSRWLATKAKSSSLFQNRSITVIPNATDTTTFRALPQFKSECRKLFHLPQDKKLILFGSSYINDPNKGFGYLQSALQNIRPNNLELVIFGEGNIHQITASVPIHYVDKIEADEILSALYNACDVTVVPSQIESFGQVAAESLSCGTPVVAFRTSGLVDIVDHLEDGYLAQPYSMEDLASGIEWVLNHPEPEKLSKRAQEKVQKMFSNEVVLQKYIQLYQELLTS